MPPEVLHQVVNVLDPIHRKPGALITAAAAPGPLGLCIIQIKNDFGHSLDFVRRAIRGATQGSTILETFPLDAFLPPTTIHVPRQWSRGMSRYKRNHLFNLNLLLYFLTLPTHLKATIHGKRKGRTVQPSSRAADDRGQGTNGAGRANGLNSVEGKIASLTSNTFTMFNKFTPLINLFTHFKYISSSISPSKYMLVLGSTPSLATQCKVQAVCNRPDARDSHNIKDKNIDSANIFKTEKGTPTPPRVGVRGYKVWHARQHKHNRYSVLI